MKRHGFRFPLACLAAAGLAAALAVPASRPTVSEQLRLALGLMPAQAFLPPPSPYYPGGALARKQRSDYERVAARHPDDVGVQMAAAAVTVPFRPGEFEQETVRRLRPLLTRYPNSPALYGNLTYFAGRALDDQMRHPYPKQVSLPGVGRIPNPFAPAIPLSRVSFAESDRWAAAGERLDPGNAYFPLMRAAGFAHAGRSKAAVAALARAAAKPRWEDYQSDLVLGLHALPGEAWGRTDPLANTAAACFETRQAPEMRNLAVFAANVASDAESRGRANEGYRIRWNILRAAHTWRTQARTSSSFVTARAVSGIAMDGFGHSKPSRTQTPSQQKLREATFALQAARIDGPGAVAWLIGDQTDSYARCSALKAAIERSPMLGCFYGAMIAWLAGYCLLDAGLWLLLLAGLGASVAGQAARRRAGLARAAAVLVALAFLAWQARALLGAVGYATPETVPAWARAAMVAGLAGLALPLVVAAFHAFADRNRGVFTGWERSVGCALIALYAAVAVLSASVQTGYRDAEHQRAVNECRYFTDLAAGRR
ncbi:MAG TPA: hypothetical protein VGM37_08640 [Armatimonadota bacterium]|jgi:hypothetical protein